MNDPRALYEFGDFALDVGQQRLLRLDGGDALALTGKTFDTLVFLIEHAGEPLDRETLLQAIWPGVVVEENSLTQIISGLRQILGETRGENRYIVTLPRKGYRFVATVNVRATTPAMAGGAKAAHGETSPAEPARTAAAIAEAASLPVAGGRAPVRTRVRPWVVGTGLVVVVGVLIAIVSVVMGWPASHEARPPTQTLAVLPFKPLLAAERNEALELGMTESLITHLARSSTRIVRPLSAVRRFTSIDQDALAAGRELGVDAVLDGLMQREGDQVRVSVRLLQVEDGRQLWARTFEQPFTRIFEVQDVIVSQIAEALVWEGRSPRSPGGREQRDTQNPEAFALFASGRFAYLRLTESSLLQALAFYEQAIALDPGYARAYAGIADCNVLLAVLGARPADIVYPKARAAAEKALQLDPKLAPAHVSLGQILIVHDHDLEGASRELARALELDPDYAPAYFYRGTLYGYQGDVGSALEAFDRAVELDPYTLSVRAGRALTLFHLRRYDESVASLRQILALDENFDLARSFLMRVWLAQGEYQRVLAEMRGRTVLGPGSYGFVGQALALSGHRDEARAELRRVLALSERQHVPAYDIATIYAALDDADSTFLWLNRAIDDSSPVGTLPFEPAFERLRADPRFARVVARTRSQRPAA